MSGGHFGYYDQRAKDEIFGYSEEWTNVFHDVEISEIVWDVLELIHDFDWYASGDTCEGDWNEARDGFKKKWLTTEGRDARIEAYIERLRQDLIGDYRRCSECSHWSKESEQYGNCDVNKGCLWHRSDTVCKDFKEAE